MNRIVDAIENQHPALAVTFTGEMTDSQIEDVNTVADIAEFRVDKYSSRESGYLINEAGRLAIMPVLATIRTSKDGGSWTYPEDERYSLFEDILPVVDGIDIELECNILSKIVKAAHDSDKIVIVSSHNFNTTPSYKELVKLMDTAQNAGADYIKIATSAKTLDDYQRLATFTISHKQDDVIVVAMDDYGPLSRIALPSLGSRLTYAFAGEPAAPGQMSYQETADLLKRVFPRD